MAAADKIYLTLEQYKLVKKWWLETRELQKKQLGHEINMYPFSMLEKITYPDGDYSKDGVVEYNYDPSESDLDYTWFQNEQGEDCGNELCVFNCSMKEDIWLWYNAPFDFLRDAAKEKFETVSYQDLPKELCFTQLVDLIDFDEPDFIYYIEQNETSIVFYGDDNDGNDCIPYAEMLVYGTTHFAKVLGQIDMFNIPDDMRILFTYCGIMFEQKNGEITVVDSCWTSMQKKIVIPYLRYNLLGLPKINYTFDRSLAENVEKTQVILSLEDKAYNADVYKNDKNGEPIPLKRLLYCELPQYLQPFLKN